LRTTNIEEKEVIIDLDKYLARGTQIIYATEEKGKRDETYFFLYDESKHIYKKLIDVPIERNPSVTPLILHEDGYNEFYGSYNIKLLERSGDVVLDVPLNASSHVIIYENTPKEYREGMTKGKLEDVIKEVHLRGEKAVKEFTEALWEVGLVHLLPGTSHYRLKDHSLIGVYNELALPAGKVVFKRLKFAVVEYAKELEE
jgi:hypothetical protein